MSFRLAVLSGLALLIAAATTRGEEPILVTARRQPTPASRSGLSIASITAEEIEARQTEGVADAIRQVPGVWITRGGGVGSSSSIFIRGAASNQTKVLLDGIALNDPTIGGQFNPYDLMTGGSDRIEVLRGSQSTLYGSEAIGGVVQLFSRDHRGPLSARLLADGGSRSTGRLRFEIGGGDETLSGGFHGSFHTTDNEVDRNEFQVAEVGGRLRARPVDSLELSLTARLWESEAQDPYGFGNPLPEDDNIERTRRTELIGGSAEWTAVDGFSLRLQASHLDVVSRFDDGPATPGAAAEFVSDATARVTSLQAGATVEGLGLLGVDPATARDRLSVGFEYEDAFSKNTTESPFGETLIEGTVRDRAWFVQEEVTLLDRVDASVGVRFTDNDIYGRETLPSASLQYRHLETDTTLAGSYARGFRAPTPIEFADPFFGNADLTEESSESWDVGVRQVLLDGRLVLGATWFRLDVDDLIAYDPATFRLENFRRTRTTGIELGGTWRIDERWSAGASFTHQSPRNRDAGASEDEDLPNRAKNFGSLWGRLDCGRWLVMATLTWSDGFDEVGIEGPDARARRHPGAKTLLDVAASYRASDRVRLFGRLENVLDDEYVELETGPRGPGFGLFLGVELLFGGETDGGEAETDTGVGR